MGKIIRLGSFFLKLIAAYILAPFVKLFCPSLRNVWIISERGNDARDNGYFFYRHMVEKHPEQPIYYVIRSNSADAKRIERAHRIESNSFSHYLFFALCRVRLSSHAWGGDVPMVDYYKKFGIYKHTHKKVAFLQHGIIKDFLPGLCYPKIQPDLFVCGALPEWQYIHDCFGHPDGVAQYTGLARYDTLASAETKNQILVMPTFRKWLQGMNLQQFAQSGYYQKWQSLLDNEAVIEMLERSGITLVFYPHYEMQKYVSLFHSKSNNVVIADFEHYDVQMLLKESKLMITDFSSVFFDFSYMRKPVVFYQFDRKAYIQKHYDYTKGYFDYDTMAPGKVVFTEEELTQQVARLADRGFENEAEYQKRRDAFFPKSDQHNCDRIFDAIMAL